jgi:hypothetical protein
MKYTCPLCDQNAENYSVKGGGTHKNHWALKG